MRACYPGIVLGFTYAPLRSKDIDGGVKSSGRLPPPHTHPTAPSEWPEIAHRLPGLRSTERTSPVLNVTGAVEVVEVGTCGTIHPLRGF